MFDHVSFRVSDRAATERFYDAVLPAIGEERAHRGEASTLYGNFELSVGQATAERPVTRGVHLGLCAPSHAAIDAFRAGRRRCRLPQRRRARPRPEYGSDYYGAFLLDPDGNSIEAVRHGRMRELGLIDHVWLRTTELEPSRGFWQRFAEDGGLGVVVDEPELIRVRAPRGGSLTVTTRTIRPPRAAGLHLAVPADSPERVDAWHAALTAAGYRSDGDPGPRPYHPSYYGAFVIEPAGHSTELVDHGGLLGPPLVATPATSRPPTVRTPYNPAPTENLLGEGVRRRAAPRRHAPASPRPGEAGHHLRSSALHRTHDPPLPHHTSS